MEQKRKKAEQERERTESIDVEVSKQRRNERASRIVFGGMVREKGKRTKQESAPWLPEPNVA